MDFPAVDTPNEGSVPQLAAHPNAPRPQSMWAAQSLGQRGRELCQGESSRWEQSMGVSLQHLKRPSQPTSSLSKSLKRILRKQEASPIFQQHYWPKIGLGQSTEAPTTLQQVFRLIPVGTRCSTASRSLDDNVALE